MFSANAGIGMPGRVRVSPPGLSLLRGVESNP